MDLVQSKSGPPLSLPRAIAVGYKRMRALVKTKSGLNFTEVPVKAPGAGEVTVRVQCAGLCRTDLQVAAGELATEFPRILGHECSGVICRLGAGVDQARLGERVAVFPWLACSACEFCRNDQDKLGYLCPQRKFLGWQVDGCFAEFLVLPADRCFPLGEEIDFQAGAYFEPLTAALGVNRAPLKQARTVAVMGGNRIAALTSLVLSECAQVEHDLLEPGKAHENSYDLVIESEATPEKISIALHSLRPNGVLVLKSRPPGPVDWPVRLQVEKELTVTAFSYGSPRLARLLLEKRPQLFRPLWQNPVPLSNWKAEFEREWAGMEDKKVFFQPQIG